MKTSTLVQMQSNTNPSRSIIESGEILQIVLTKIATLQENKLHLTIEPVAWSPGHDTGPWMSRVSISIPLLDNWHTYHLDVDRLSYLVFTTKARVDWPLDPVLLGEVAEDSSDGEGVEEQDTISLEDVLASHGVLKRVPYKMAWESQVEGGKRWFSITRRPDSTWS